MSTVLFELVLGALAGPLVVAGAAKLLTPQAKLSWPYETGSLRAPYGPRLVGTGECAAALGIVLLPGSYGALLAFVMYALLTGTAYRLRGQNCACFGLARLAAVGRAHIVGNASGAIVGAVLIFVSPAGGPMVRGLGAGIGVFVVAATVLALDRRSQATEVAAPCTERISGVRLYVSTSCPACRSLEGLLATMEPARQDAVDVIVLSKEQKLPAAMSDMGVPAATAVDATGTPICTPVSGIGAVKALVDTITISSTADTRAR